MIFFFKLKGAQRGQKRLVNLIQETFHHAQGRHYQEGSFVLADLQRLPSNHAQIRLVPQTTPTLFWAWLQSLQPHKLEDDH